MAPERQIPWSWSLKKVTQGNEIVTQYKEEDVTRRCVKTLRTLTSFLMSFEDLFLLIN